MRCGVRARANVKCQLRPSRLEEQHVVGIQHRVVRVSSVSRPDRTVIERFECLVSALHTREASQPHEAIRVAPIAKLPNQRHARCFLRLDKMALEEVDQDVALAWLQGVLPQFERRATARFG